MNNYDAKRAGGRVRATRKGRGWTQEQLAQGAGLSAGYVAQFERGEQRRARRLTLETIARALGWPDWETLITSEALVPPNPIPVLRPEAPPAELDATVSRIVRRELREWFRELVRDPEPVEVRRPRGTLRLLPAKRRRMNPNSQSQGAAAQQVLAA